MFLFSSNSAVVLADLQPAGFEAVGLCALGRASPDITGRGVTIGLVCRSLTYSDGQPRNDYKVDVSHNCFSGRRIKFFNGSGSQPSVSKHSTAIASILAGCDPNAYFEPLGEFTYEGAAPDADLNVYEFWQFVIEYVFSGKWPAVDLFSISLGSSFEGWWTRGIDRMAENFGILVVAAIGNGKDAYDLPLYPAAGANVLAVGVVDSNTSDGLVNSLSDFSLPDANHSTAGPTMDGRCKPDIVAPGNYLVAFAGSTDLYEPTGDYSSFAAPAVAGVASLLIQQAKSDPNLQFALLPTVGNCVMKSILMTSAKKLTGWHKGCSGKADDSVYPLDFKQGAGLIDAASAFKLLTAGIPNAEDVKRLGWSVNVIEPNYTQEKTYRIKIANPENAKFTATLVWNRIYQNEYPFAPVLDEYADLQLELWAVDANGTRDDLLIDFSNSPVDNVEHLYVGLDPNHSDYELVVSNSLESELPLSSTIYALSWKID